MKSTKSALAFLGGVVAIVGCSHLASDGGKQTDTHVLTLRHEGYPSNPNQTQHAYRRVRWWLKEGNKPAFGMKVKSNDWIEWHNTNEPLFAIAVPHAEEWKPGPGLSFMSIPNLGTWPAVATTNGHLRLQFTPNSNTTRYINYRIAIAPASEVYAMQAPQSNFCDVDIIQTIIDFGGGFTNPVARSAGSSQ
jgi:hypothetical protein